MRPSPSILPPGITAEDVGDRRLGRPEGQRQRAAHRHAQLRQGLQREVQSMTARPAQGKHWSWAARAGPRASATPLQLCPPAAPSPSAQRRPAPPSSRLIWATLPEPAPSSPSTPPPTCSSRSDTARAAGPSPRPSSTATSVWPAMATLSTTSEDSNQSCITTWCEAMGTAPSLYTQQAKRQQGARSWRHAQGSRHACLLSPPYHYHYSLLGLCWLLSARPQAQG